MADNIDVTPGTGATVAADDIGGVKFPRVKLIHGADGVNDGDVAEGNPLPVADANLAQTVKQKNSAANVADFGLVMLAQRRDSDTPETTVDGQYTAFKQDEAGRLKVATQPGSVPASSGNITAAAQFVAIATNRISNLSIAMVATTLVGHNAIFEVSNDSTNGTDGNWKTVQAVRTDSNVVETTTGVLAATPAYAWELNVASYAWFRVRATAHTSGTAAYVLKPGAYATEPVPSSQNAPLQTFSFTQAGVIAVNTVLLSIDCLTFRSLYIQLASIGTSGVITYEWSNDGTVWASSFNVVSAGALSITQNTVGIVKTQVHARYFRARLSTATTAGTTTLSVTASQQSDTSVTQVVGSVGLSAGVARIGYVSGAGIWYDDSSTVLAAAASFTGTSRDLTGGSASASAFASTSAYSKELRVSAESDQSGTLWLEASRDGTNWRRIKSVATAAVTGGGQYAEIVHRPSWQYARVGFTNGATLQTRFTIGTQLIAA